MFFFFWEKKGGQKQKKKKIAWRRFFGPFDLCASFRVIFGAYIFQSNICSKRYI